MDSYDKNLQRFEQAQGAKIDPHGIKTGVRVCKNCGRKLLHGVEGDLCPLCAEQELFCDVRDYIRANDVRDYEVAQHFNIPLSKVKNWIKQGRIQYKDDPSMKQVLMGNYCQVCGSPTNFGTICPKCMKERKKSQQIGVAIGQPKPEGSNKMRFMEDDK
ncbi:MULTISPECIES: hypothetical protein [unclassified Butyrivibrio]|uniref:hypothetical protein n=1 Tax=unclassified Butyrivibrio TaxID=2639466 RepID=UPI0003B5AE3F|nr:MULTISPECIES: hypothetical protein [unclassified Butyrivibrio]SEL37682.1 hypothetical protein SAMN04487770_10972 [Butyrivibrio sp. ob235]